jgi:chromosome segregation ATPase
MRKRTSVFFDTHKQYTDNIKRLRKEIKLKQAALKQEKHNITSNTEGLSLTEEAKNEINETTHEYNTLNEKIAELRKQLKKKQGAAEKIAKNFEATYAEKNEGYKIAAAEGTKPNATEAERDVYESFRAQMIDELE